MFYRLIDEEMVQIRLDHLGMKSLIEKFKQMKLLKIL